MADKIPATGKKPQMCFVTAWATENGQYVASGASFESELGSRQAADKERYKIEKKNPGTVCTHFKSFKIVIPE